MIFLCCDKVPPALRFSISAFCQHPPGLLSSTLPCFFARFPAAMPQKRPTLAGLCYPGSGPNHFPPAFLLSLYLLPAPRAGPFSHVSIAFCPLPTGKTSFSCLFSNFFCPFHVGLRFFPSAAIFVFFYPSLIYFFSGNILLSVFVKLCDVAHFFSFTVVLKPLFESGCFALPLTFIQSNPEF